MIDTKGVVAARYENLFRMREHVLRRAREASALTIPNVIVRDGHNETSELPTPYQSVGSRGVRNLASKFLLSLFPPNVPFFKYTIDDLAVEEIEAEAGDIGRGEVEKALNKRERLVMKEIESSYFRTAAFEAFKHLIISGNVLMHIPEDGMAQVFGLDKFVVSRDPRGTVLEIVLKQHFAPESLPPEAQQVLQAAGADMTAQGNTSKPSVALFTGIRRTNKGRYEVIQEIAGQLIPNTRKVYDADNCPWVALRLTKIDGEDYGRGYVEDFLGDLISLEGLSQAVLEGSAIASRVITLVNPNGTTNIRDVAQAENGAVIAGSPDEVQMLQSDGRINLSVAQQQVQALNQQLSFAFLMNTAVQRQAERVTAQEIRFMAQELESALGGMYSLLAQEFQLPMVTLFEKRMEKNRQVPALPEGVTMPKVVTGLDALGRGQDLQNLDAFLMGLGEVMGPEIQKYLNFSEYINRRGAALGIDMENLIKSEEEIAQAEQQAQMMGLAQNMGPQAIQAFAQIQGKQMDGDAKVAAEQVKKEG